jgi:hypothetical protein
MNTHAPNPFTGLKGALAGLMSGGWRGLLLGLLFRHRIAPMLAALEKLFAQFQAGTLKLPAAPAAGPQAAAPAAPRPRAPTSYRRASAARTRPVARAAAVRPAHGAAPGVRPAPRGAGLHRHLYPAARLPPAPLSQSRVRCRRNPRWDGPVQHALIITIS